MWVRGISGYQTKKKKKSLVVSVTCKLKHYPMNVTDFREQA